MHCKCYKRNRWFQLLKKYALQVPLHSLRPLVSLRWLLDTFYYNRRQLDRGAVMEPHFPYCRSMRMHAYYLSSVFYFHICVIYRVVCRYRHTYNRLSGRAATLRGEPHCLILVIKPAKASESPTAALRRQRIPAR